jgi:hypothetical protein
MYNLVLIFIGILDIFTLIISTLNFQILHSLVFIQSFHTEFIQSYVVDEIKLSFYHFLRTEIHPSKFNFI